jgi:AAA domain
VSQVDRPNGAGSATPVPVPTPTGGTGNRFPEPSGTSRNRGLAFESLPEFLARAAKEPQRGWLIPKLVPDRGRLFVVSPPNTGKTWLALLAAKMALDAGRTVFMVEEEGSARGLADRFNALRIEPSERLLVAHLGGCLLTDAAHRRTLVNAVRGTPNPVMALDPFSALWAGDENSTQEATKVRGHLDELAKANPSGLIMVAHHTSKASSAGLGSEIHAGRGSSVFAAWADVQLNLKAIASPSGSGKIRFEVSVAKDREGERGYKARVEFDLSTGSVAIDQADAIGTNVLGKVHEQVLLFLASASSALSKNAICEGVKGRRENVFAAVDELTAAGKLAAVDGGYRLHNEVTEHAP